MSKSTVVVYFRDSETNNQGAIRGIRRENTSPIKHQIFSYYSNIAEFLGETKWVKFFDSLSRGNFYKNLKFDGVSLICKIKSSKFIKYDLICSQTMNIQTDLNTDIHSYNGCKNFIESNTTFFIENDDVSDTLQNENEKQPVSITPQFELSSGLSVSINNQLIFIGEFTVRKCREFGLSEGVRRSLYSSIIAMLSSKDLISKSFSTYRNGQIESVEGLFIDHNGFNFVPNKKGISRALKISSPTTETQSPIKTSSWPSQRAIRFYT